MKDQKILLFGGAFDPFHKGHLEMLNMVIKSIKINQVLIIPNYMCPNKRKPLLSGKKRIMMVKSIIKDIVTATHNTIHISCSDYEIKQQKVCFTIDTIKMLKDKNKMDDIYLLIGSDNFFSFHLWKDYQAILKRVTLCVVRRDTKPIAIYQNYLTKQGLSAIEKPVFIIGNKPITISSSQVRSKLANNESISDLVPKAVLNIIKKKND